MENNIELSSSDDDDCRLVLGPQFSRKLKRPVKLQTGRDAVKKARNDFNNIVSCLGDTNEYDPRTRHFDAVFEISDINELLNMAPLSENWSSALFNEGQDETACTVEDCRHNKSANAEENNNTTINNGLNQKKSEISVTKQASSLKTNVPESSTEFKVPNPVGPLTSRSAMRNSIAKKKQRSALTKQNNISQRQTVLRFNNAGFTANGLNSSESSTSSSSSSKFNPSDSNKSTPIAKTTSSNSTKESESNSSKKSSKSTEDFPEKTIPVNRSNRKKSYEQSDSSNKSNTESESECKESDTSSNFDLIVITSDESESSSSIHKISTAMLANAVVAAEIKVMDEKLNKSVRKLTIGFVKLFTKNAEDIDILGENDDTFTASGRFEVENKLKKRKYPDGTSRLELHMTILTTIFRSVASKAASNNDQEENIDQKINNEQLNNGCNNDRKKNGGVKNNRKKNETLKNDQRTNKKPDNEQEINKNTGIKRKINKDIKNDLKLNIPYNSERNEINSKKRKSKCRKLNQDNDSEGRKYVDPNQPSTSKNYDPSCVFAVSPTSKSSNNTPLSQNSSASDVEENGMDVDSSNDTENPVEKQENLTVEDLARPGCNNQFVYAEQRRAFKQIKSAVDAWIKQCIDNVPIKKPAQERDIMHDKVLRALSKKLRLLYNNCYDILRNKKIQIIVPVSEDPNSKDFKPVITLSTNTKTQHLTFDGSDTSSEGSVFERDLEVSSETDVAGSEQSIFRNKDTQNIQNGTNRFNDYSSSSLSLNSTSEGNDSSENSDRESIKDSSTSQSTLDDIKRTSNSQTSYQEDDKNSFQTMDKKEEKKSESKIESDNDDFNPVQSDQEQNSSQDMDFGRHNYIFKDNNSEDNISLDCNESSCISDGMQNASKSKYYSDEMSSLSEYFGERNNFEGVYDNVEQISYDADVDDLNSSVDDEYQDEKSKSLVLSQNDENDNIQSNDEEIEGLIDRISVDDENEDDSKDDCSDDNHNFSHSDGSLNQNSNNESRDDLEVVPGQCANVDTNIIQDGLLYNRLLDVLYQTTIDKVNTHLSNPSQVFHGQHDTVSNNSDVSMNAHEENQRGNKAMHDNNQIQIPDVQECNGAVRRFDNEIAVTTTNTNQHIENTEQLPTNEIQIEKVFSLSENVCFSQTDAHNSPSEIPNNSCCPNTLISSIQEVLNFQSTIPNLDSQLNVQSESQNSATEQSEDSSYISNHTTSDLIESLEESEWALSDSENSDSNTCSDSNETTDDRTVQHSREESPVPNSLEMEQSRVESRVQNLLRHLQPSRAESPIANTQDQEWQQPRPESPLFNTQRQELRPSRLESFFSMMRFRPTRSRESFINNRLRLTLQQSENRLLGIASRSPAFQQSSMQDTHRNLWLRQQYQLETLRRHALQMRPTPVDGPLTRSTTHARRSQDTAALAAPHTPPSPRQSQDINQPFSIHDVVNQSPAPPPPPSEILDVIYHPWQRGHRLLTEANPSSIAPIQSAVNQLNLPFSNLPSHIDDLRRRLSIPLPRVLQPPIVIEDDNDGDNEEAGSTIAPTMEYSFSLRRFDPRRFFNANIEHNPSMSSMEFHYANDDDDIEDEDPLGNTMHLQELVDSTTVVFEYDGLTQEERCNICLNDYARNEILRRLPCFHTYHRNCIDQWLSRERRTCPNCRMFLSSHLPFANTST